MNGHTVTCLKIPGQYVRVFNGIVKGCSSHMVFVTGQHIVVDGLTVKNGVTENGTTKCGTFSTGWGSAIKAEKGSSDVLIKNNIVYENCGEGIDTTMASQITIENNIAYDNFSFNYYADNSNDIIIRNNLGYYTGNTAYYRNGKVGGCALVGAEDYTSYGWTINRINNYLIEGNKLENCDGIGLWNPVNAPLVNVIIRNNLFYRVTSPYVRVPGATVSNNTLSLQSFLINGTPVPKIGDINYDGTVNIIDIGIIIDNYGHGASTFPKSDLNSDGLINIVDIGIVIDNYGK